MAFCSMHIAAGILGVVLVAKILRGFAWRRRRMLGFGGPFAFAGACGGAPCGGDASGGWRGFGGWGRRRPLGRSMWLRALFHRLDTTPGQEREIRAALEELASRTEDAGAQAKRSREALGRAVAGAAFDDGAFEATSARIDASVAQVKDAMRGALARIHAALDDRQRERLAALLAYGWRGGRRERPPEAGPYRGAREHDDGGDGPSR